jgi:hypothetical protein
LTKVSAELAVIFFPSVAEFGMRAIRIEAPEAAADYAVDLGR